MDALAYMNDEDEAFWIDACSRLTPYQRDLADMMDMISQEPQYAARCVLQELMADAIVRLYVLGFYQTLWPINADERWREARHA
jgi:hypothetical protein